MMSIRGWGSSLVFGALSALSLVLVEGLLFARLTSGSLVWPTVAGCLLVYAGLLGRDARERMRNLLVAGVVVALVLAAAGDGATIAVGLTLGLAIVRTGLDARLRTPRGWLREGLLGAAALLFASGLLSPGVVGGALAFWGFALVQSLFFLLPPFVAEEPDGARDGVSRERDAFERARAQLLILLDDR